MMTEEELQMVRLVRESDVIDRTDGSELARAFNYLFDKFIEPGVVFGENVPNYDPSERLKTLARHTIDIKHRASVAEAMIRSSHK